MEGKLEAVMGTGWRRLRLLVAAVAALFHGRLQRHCRMMPLTPNAAEANVVGFPQRLILAPRLPSPKAWLHCPIRPPPRICLSSGQETSAVARMGQVGWGGIAPELLLVNQHSNRQVPLWAPLCLEKG